MLNQKISNASFMAALMVVGIHVGGDPALITEGSSLWWLEAFGHYGIFSIAVPFFFVCSGYFLAGHMEEPGWYKRECVKRFRSLAVPYVFWCLAYASIPLVASCLSCLLHGRETMIPEDYANVRFWSVVFGLNPLAWPYFIPLWFVRALMMFTAISPLLFYLIKKSGWIGLLGFLLLAIAVGTYGRFLHIKIHLVLTKCFNVSGLFYFCCGIYGRLTKVRLPGKGHVIALAYGLVCAAASGYCRMSGIKFFAQLWIPALLFGLWRFVPERPLPKCLAGSAFAIYILHFIVFRCLGLMFNATVETVLQWILKWAAGVVVSMSVALAFRKASPKFADFAFGGR